MALTKNNMKKSKRGGARKKAGRKRKYKVATSIFQLRCPTQIHPEIKKLAEEKAEPFKNLDHE